MKRRILRIALVLTICLAGAMVTSQFSVQTVQAKTVKQGWKKTSKGYKYRLKNGKYVKNKFRKIKGKYYYFSKKGYRVTGLKTIKSKKYYFSSKGVRKTGIRTVKGKKYYFKPYAYVNRWISGNTYYAGADGAFYRNGIFAIANVAYNFDANGKCIGQATSVDSLDSNGKTYRMEPSVVSDPQIGGATGLTEEDLLTAAVYTEAGNQGTIGMQAVALVILNRKISSSFPNDLKNVIYQKSQFSIASGGLLTKVLTDPALHAKTSIYYEAARQAVLQAQAAVDSYVASAGVTPRVLAGFPYPIGKTDFDYLYFMTPKAFEASKLDPVKSEAATYTTDAALTSGHTFFRYFVYY